MTAEAEVAVYQTAQLDQYQAQLTMTPEQAQALDEQVRRCTEAVLREGTDYGIIPGTNGEKSLWRPGAQKLLQWFGLGYTCERIEVERDDDGRKHGITYKCTVARRLPDGTLDIKATCEGTADYDESKFHQSAEEVQRKAEARERMWAEKDRRVANPTKWKNLSEYRADWNALMKRAQKRAIVGAVNDATAAGGIFSDREEDESSPVADDGSTWCEQALEAVWVLTDKAELDELYVAAVHAARDGLCSHKQKDWVQNAVRKRQEQLKTAKPVDVEDLARQAAETAGPDEPGTATVPQIGAIWTVLSTVFKFGRDEKDQARAVCSYIAERAIDSTKDMSLNEAKAVLDTLASWRETAEQHGEQPREFLIELMATAEPAEPGEDPQ